MIAVAVESGPIAHDGSYGLPATLFGLGIMRANQTLSNVVGSPCHLKGANMAQTAHYVHFGSIVMEQGRCTACGDRALITKSGRSSCCHAPIVTLKNEKHHFEVPIAKRRTTPLRKFQKAYILRMQENRCFWCGISFDSWIAHPRYGVKQIEVEWDHYIPYVVGGPDEMTNFVAACRICNRHKAAYVLNDWCVEEELRQRLRNDWGLSGWTLVSREPKKAL